MALASEVCQRCGANRENNVPRPFLIQRITRYVVQANSETLSGEYQVLSLRALVQIKLTAYRDKDRTHLRDLLEVGLVDASWLQFYPPELANRLRALIETPGG